MVWLDLYDFMCHIQSTHLQVLSAKKWSAQNPTSLTVWPLATAMRLICLP